jgi:hypothetical protein
MTEGRIPSFVRRPLIWITEPEARSASVLVDELDAGDFEGSPYCSVIWSRQGSFTIAKLSAPDSRDSNLRFPSQIFRAPTEERPRSPDLTARKRFHELTSNDM